MRSRILVIFGLYWGYIWIMEKKMETTIMGDIKFRDLGFWEAALTEVRVDGFLTPGTN